MPTKITYYAIVNEFSSRERPGGVIRRIVADDGRDDQAFTRDLKWEHTGTLYSYERGDGTTSCTRSPRTRPTRSSSASAASPPPRSNGNFCSITRLSCLLTSNSGSPIIVHTA
jgi:hypothetical protein